MCFARPAEKWLGELCMLSLKKAGEKHKLQSIGSCISSPVCLGFTVRPCRDYSVLGRR